ncbi:hypothetical protein FRC00_006825 [Tulasnella sp. 408]|nr:hypothetical protein FRC00_006825 [Tulasnella sp. 408]
MRAVSLTREMRQNLFEAAQFQQAENIVADRLKDPMATFKHIAEQGSIGSNGLTSVKAPATLAVGAPTAPALSFTEFGPNTGGSGTSISLSKAAKPPTFGSSSCQLSAKQALYMVLFKHTPQISHSRQSRPSDGISWLLSRACIISAESVKKDLTRGDERPEWPLSTYGPARHKPPYITGTDLSPEEMRVRAYELRAQKRLDKYGLFEAAQFQQAEKIVVDLLKDPMITFKHITERGSIGPNGLTRAQPLLVSPSETQEVAGSPGSATYIIDPSVISVSNSVPENSVQASLGRSAAGADSSASSLEFMFPEPHSPTSERNVQWMTYIAVDISMRGQVEEPRGLPQTVKGFRDLYKCQNSLYLG